MSIADRRRKFFMYPKFDRPSMRTKVRNPPRRQKVTPFETAARPLKPKAAKKTPVRDSDAASGKSPWEKVFAWTVLIVLLVLTVVTMWLAWVSPSSTRYDYYYVPF